MLLRKKPSRPSWLDRRGKRWKEIDRREVSNVHIRRDGMIVWKSEVIEGNGADLLYKREMPGIRAGRYS